MIQIKLGGLEGKLSVLCLGAHSDDIEIGAGGALLSWISQGLKLDVHWCVLSAPDGRRTEAEESAKDFLAGAQHINFEALPFQDGIFPAQTVDIKSWFENLKHRTAPDVILTHTRDDAHQDHREVCRHTWNTFRDHLILEYEIPKWDGDLGQPNFYVPLEAEILERKIAMLEKHFGSQRSKHWFDHETFKALARLRGVEARSRYAEAFYARKMVMV
jgi:LmbE family N-acetylglucosaminyl deacetylase